MLKAFGRKRRQKCRHPVLAYFGLKFTFARFPCEEQCFGVIEDKNVVAQCIALFQRLRALLQAMITGRLTSTDDVCAEIDRVTLSDVQDVAKRVINGKASMAAVGDLAHTPFLDQIL